MLASVKRLTESQSMETSRKPNLFLIGAMKSGTTYLAKLLGAHPAIFICSPEESSYFVDSAQLRKLYPKMWDLGFWRSERRYLQLFENGRTAVLLGEASTDYTKHPLFTRIPERIHKFNPHARFIYETRDPIEWTVSHYWHTFRGAMFGPFGWLGVDGTTADGAGYGQP
jgi:hypothetical protein